MIAYWLPFLENTSFSKGSCKSGTLVFFFLRCYLHSLGFSKVSHLTRGEEDKNHRVNVGKA